ncbi:MAG: GNAT family N-acetyltransferase [Parvularculaceae bacterium]
MGRACGAAQSALESARKIGAANRALVAFHERLREAKRAVHLFRVRVGGETIGVLWYLLWNGRAMNHQSGFRFEEDLENIARLLTHFMAGEHYRRQGVEIYDYLAGDDDYKARLGERETVLMSFVVERPTWRRRLRRGLVRR